MAGEDALHNRPRDESLTLLDRVFAHAPVGFAILDTGLRYLCVNAALAHLNGVPAEAHVGRAVQEVVPPERWPEIEARLHRALAGEVVRNAEQPGEDAATFYEASYYPVWDSGAIVAVGVLVEDVTERKRAEAALRESRRFLQGVADTAPVIVYVYSLAQNRNVYSNREVGSILGYTPEEIQQMGDSFFARTFHPDFFARLPGQFQRLAAARDGQIVETEYQMRHARGEWRWLYSREIVFTRTETGQPDQILGTAEDITERKRAEERIRRHHDELSTLHAVTAAIGRSLELPDVVATLEEQLAQRLSIAGGALFLGDLVEGRCGLEGSWGLPEPVLSRLQAVCLGVLRGPGGREPRRPVLTPDFRDIAVLVEAGLDRERPEWQSYLAVPLITGAGGEIQGILALFDSPLFRFTEDSLAFFEALGNEVAVVVEHARLFREVRSGREQLHTLSRQLVELQEAERAHVARELHDQVGQMLTGLKFTLEAAQRGDAGSAPAALESAHGLIAELMLRVRELSLDLRPAMLDDLGLLPALRWHFERYTAQTSVQVRFQRSGKERRFAPAVEIAVYRIVQEALTNAARHADVAEVTVRLWVLEDRGRKNTPATTSLGVQIVDHGRGFDVEAALSAGATGGLVGMRERAALLGGTMVVESARGKGTVLTLELFLPREAK